MSRIKLAIVISFIMSFVMLLTSCGGNTAPASGKVLTEAELMADDGTFLYTLVYPGGSISDDVYSEVKNIYSQLRKTFDIKIMRKTDTEAIPADDTYEIVCGRTSREVTKKATDLLKANRANYSNDFIITVIGRKIVINGGNDAATVRGLRYFVENFCQNAEEFSKLTDGFSYIKTNDYKIKSAKIAGDTITDYTVVVPKKHSLLWTDGVEKFVSVFAEDAGIDLKTVKDTDTDATEKEILIGNTNREESGGLTGSQWCVKLVGKKLVVNGTDDIQICAAISALTDMQQTCIKEGKAFEIPEGYVLTGTAEKNDEDYYMAWHDEFNGKTLDRTIWQDLSWNSEKDPSVMGGTVYKPDSRDVYVENGSMVVPAKRLSREDFQAGQPTTEGTLAARYGVIEFYAKFPQYPVTTAIWAQTPKYELDPVKGKVSVTRPVGMELDIVESFGSETAYAANVHNWFSNEDMSYAYTSGHTSLDGGKYGTAKKFTFKEGSLADDYHYYSIRWTPYEMSFAFDGDVYFTYDLTKSTGTSFTNLPQYFLTGVSYGSVGYGPSVIADDAPKETSLYIDFFRIYQSDKYDNILWVTPVGSKFH